MAGPLAEIVVLGSWLGIFVGVNEDLSGRKLEASSLNPDGKSRKGNGGMGEEETGHEPPVRGGNWAMALPWQEIKQQRGSGEKINI